MESLLGFDNAGGPWGDLPADPDLSRIRRKLQDGVRLDFEDGLACLETKDLLGLGHLAWTVRRSLYGDEAYYIANHHLNYTNICINQCRFCAFHRIPGDSAGYTLTPDEAVARIQGAELDDLQEVHVVGGCNPAPDLDYYVRLLEALSAARPGLHLKAFTAVEIAHIAARAGLDTLTVLERLKAAGLKAMPGGGAEVFSERIRRILFPRKPDADQWLEIHGQAHSLGIPTNATLLFGHVETLAERVEHLLRLRAQQDLTRGFQCFIPLPFHPANTPLSHLPGPSGVEILKLMALSRLMLDNIPHLKAYWIMLGEKLTQVALHFGADDLEGTIVQERIAHQAGAATAQGLTRMQVETLIRGAGFVPVPRDTFHNRVVHA